ncbi:MAG: phage minor head protein [Phycisphaerae bacterium]
MSRRVEQLRSEWLRLHAANETRFARAIARYFREQGRRLIRELRGAGVISINDVDAAIDWEAEHFRFMNEIARPHLFSMAAVGIEVAFQRLGAKSFGLWTKSDDDDEDEDEHSEFFIRFDELPEEIHRGINGTLAESMKQPHWRNVQRGQRNAIQGAIEEGLQSGEFHERHLQRRISAATGGKVAGKRARRIARTEVGGALNAGHFAALEALAAEGIKISRIWYAIMDKHTRVSHRNMHGIQANAGESFQLGRGYECPYPGYHLLPPKERINCRCTIISADLTAEELALMSGEDAQQAQQEAVIAVIVGMRPEVSPTGFEGTSQQGV